MALKVGKIVILKLEATVQTSFRGFAFVRGLGSSLTILCKFPMHFDAISTSNARMMQQFCYRLLFFTVS